VQNNCNNIISMVSNMHKK